MATNIFVYRSDGLAGGGGGGHLAIIVGTGEGRAFDQFFQMPGVCPGKGDARGWN